jgi:RecG-like helicase
MILFIIDENIMNNTKQLLNTTHQSWRIEYYSLLKTKGVDTLLDFLKMYPTISYNDIDSLIGIKHKNDKGNNIHVEVRIESLLQEEAKKYNQKLFAIKDSFVRYLHKDNVKWSKKTKQIEHRVMVYSMWSSFVCSCYPNKPRPELIKRIKQIWDYIEEQVAGNISWLPVDTEDSIISKAFEKFWFDNS